MVDVESKPIRPSSARTAAQRRGPATSMRETSVSGAANGEPAQASAARVRGNVILGLRLRALRKSRNLTLDVLADMIGLTKGYLSKLETGRQAPPLSTLSKLAHALKADMSSLLEEETVFDDPIVEHVSLVRANERPRVVRGGTSFGYDYQALAHNFSNKRMAPFMFTFPSQILKEVFFEHAGEEMVFILSGTVEFQVGKEVYELFPGDCIYFDARLRHRGRGKYGEAKAVVVTFDPENVV